MSIVSWLSPKGMTGVWSNVQDNDQVAYDQLLSIKNHTTVYLYYILDCTHKHMQTDISLKSRHCEIKFQCAVLVTTIYGCLATFLL